LALWYEAFSEPQPWDLASLALGWAVWAAWALLPALLGATLESLPHGFDDNLFPPLAVVVVGFLASQGREVLAVPDLGLAAVVNTLCAALALASKTLRPGGVVVAWILGMATWAAAGWQGFLLLLAFLLAGLGATFLGFQRKAGRGLAEGHGGRRGAGELLAKGGVLLVLVLGGWQAQFSGGSLVLWAVVACLAAAWADTWGSELGGLWGRRVWRLPDLRPVPAGTPGGVSLPGLGASFLGACLASFLGWALHLLSGLEMAMAEAVSAFLATLGESLLAADARATHAGRNLVVTLLPLVLLVALWGGQL
jgi:uncharacterized protein (TIGR00297 family)